MQRSPIFLAALFLFATLAATGQQSPASAEPKSGSGLPQAPMATPQAPNPSGTATAPTSPASTASQPAAATPSPSPRNGSQPQNTPATSQNAGQSSKAGVEQPATTPQQPKTEILDTSATSSGLATDGHDPILDPPPQPVGTTTLVGGTIRDIDRIRNRMVVKVFGGGHWTIFFDERTHIFRNGAETTPLALKKGERVYADTMLDQERHDIFARNIRVGVTTPPADADGQIIEVDPNHGELVLRDNINSVPVHFGVDQQTRISSGSTPATFKDIKQGSLVHVKFAPESGNRGLAREITIVAAPGAAFTFAGKLTYLDMHRGLLAVQNNTDAKTYDIHFNPSSVADAGTLGVGAEVKVIATFEGTRYTAQSVSVVQSASAGK
ncbi:MAG TPA: DUF5666 domain-containing protein [Candidatus Angelobacter sp.]|nr:DUF5666 domain-containing protein [Candidatus Angelobacter sp.]